MGLHFVPSVQGALLDRQGQHPRERGVLLDMLAVPITRDANPDGQHVQQCPELLELPLQPLVELDALQRLGTELREHETEGTLLEVEAAVSLEAHRQDPQGSALDEQRKGNPRPWPGRHA
jgi:hypothetical protein